MISWAYFSPMPGRASSWSLVAELMSTSWAAEAVAAGFVCAVAELGCQMATPIPRNRTSARSTMRLMFLFIFFSPLGQVQSHNNRGVLVLLRSAIASLDGVGFGHVFALLRLSVVAATGLVIDAGIGVDPDHAVAVGRRGLLCGGLRGSRRGGRRRGCGSLRCA